MVGMYNNDIERYLCVILTAKCCRTDYGICCR